jgi:site-specific DNA recombinase
LQSKTQRQSARNEDDLSKGVPLLGQRPFGFEIDKMTIRESETKHIREAYRALIAGESTLYGIAKTWNAPGLRTSRAGLEWKDRDAPASGLWNTNNVRANLTRPGVAGILVSKGVERPSNLPAIVSRDDRDTLLAILADPSRVPKRGPKVTHFLRGILTCPCGGTMQRAVISSGPKYRFETYRCKLSRTPGLGSHSYISQSEADAYVDLNVYILMASRAAKGAPVETPRIANLVRDLAELRRKRGVVQTIATMEAADLSKVATDLADLGRQISEAESELEGECSAQAGTQLLDQITSSVFAGDMATRRTRRSKNAS